ncbi:hypothetical protein CASFOL_026525 [Castilleja foliolosa]|uniref:KIB1-4 beta-propeller domain-containing protein n=1 Tax=Castilleja foliolosa TaxID=1961234 RepID=A0ABD3CHB3_9LAMI
MAFSSSSLLRLICPKGIFRSTSNYSILAKWSARSCASSFNQRGLSTATATTAIEAVRKHESPPWLMLPSESEGGTIMNYKFYSLSDNKVQTLCLSDEIRDLRLTNCRGSSHGWLALLRPHDDDPHHHYFFLYNPISRRHIKLPSIPEYKYVTKVILSCSPDEDEENCRALMINIPNGKKLALCCPGRSKEWTAFSDENTDWYKDCVYSAQLKLFFVLTYDGIETWDLGEISSPKLIKVDNFNIDEFRYSSSQIQNLLRKLRYGPYGTVRHLVVAGEDILLVIQYIMNHVGPDGSCFDGPDIFLFKNFGFHVFKYDSDMYPYMTFGFDVFKYDSEKGKYDYLDSSGLGDLAIFVGTHNHSVGIKATQFPGVKPNSVYFTDGCYTGSLHGNDSDASSSLMKQRSGHDIGIYNYQDKTVSPCYYPCDAPSLKNILPAPIWFFPN